MKIGFRALLILAGVVLLFANWDNLAWKLTPLPDVLVDHLEAERPARVVFLYGGDLCTTCRAKRVLESMKQDPALVLVFEEELSDGEIQNFMQTFELDGTPVRGNRSVERYLERLAATTSTEQWRRSYTVDYRGNRIVSFDMF